MVELSVIALAAFLGVGLKVLQQRNVQGDHYYLVPPVSFGLACTEVYVISTVAAAGQSLALILFLGTGGALGALLAMIIHKKFVGDKA